MRAGRVGGVALGMLLLGAVGCGDDAGDPIELSTSCGDFRDHGDTDRSEAVTALGPESGWDEASVDEVDAVCAETTKATLEDVFAAAVLGPLDTASALVETYCRQVDIYVDAVEEQAEHLEDLDSEEMAIQGTDLTNAAVRLPELDDEQRARVDECTERADTAALLLVPA